MFGNQRASVRLIGALAITTLTLGTAVGAHAAPAKKKKVTIRTQKVSYQAGCGFAVDIAGNGVRGSYCPVSGDYPLALRGKEKFVSIAVTDSSGVKVGGDLWLSDGTGDAEGVPFCGTLKNYKSTQPTYHLNLDVSASTSCPGLPTSGTITITYSSARLK